MQGRTGGKGTVRRTKKVVHKTTSTDDKRLTATLKRLGVNSIPGIEEVCAMCLNTILILRSQHAHHVLERDGIPRLLV